VSAQPTAAGRQGTRSRSQHERRKRIMAAAAALASRGGVEKMQMRTVADRAGVALGTLYRYFPSKINLVAAVASEELDLLEASLDRRPPGASTPSGRATEVLMRAARGLMREPELADALIRSLLVSDVKAGFGDRMSGLLLRASVGTDAEVAAGDPRRVPVGALCSVWIMEMIEMLRGRAASDDVQARLQVAADRLLADF
jgi:AcrR family transcriptional regulator